MKKITAFLLIMVLMFTLTGCGEIQQAESAVNNLFASLKTLDLEGAKQYTSSEWFDLNEEDSTLPVEAESFLKTLMDHLEYEIVSSEMIDTETVHVTTKITTLDMKPIIQNFFTKALEYAFANAFSSTPPSDEETEQKMVEILLECIDGSDLTTVTNEVTIVVKAENGKWKVNGDDVLLNALLGGLNDAVKELENSFAGFGE